MAPASADVNSIISGCPRCNDTRNVVVMATSATPPASPSRPSIRFRALMTPTIQSIVNGMLARGLESAEGLDAELARQDFDAVVCDVNLPGEDGFSVLARLRSRSAMFADASVPAC